MTLFDYLEALTELEPRLPAEEREELRRYQQSPEFRGDSRWPGWARYLGRRPEPRAQLQAIDARRRKSA